MLAARRLAYRVAHAGLRVWWALRRPHTRGVKLLLVRGDGALLFVRHTYGHRREWELPGGRLGRREAPQDAAAREAREELGLDLPWRPVGTVEIGGYGKTTTLHAFTATLDARQPLRVQAAELAEVRWAPRAAPPAPLGQDAPAVLSL